MALQKFGFILALSLENKVLVIVKMRQLINY